MLCKKFSLAFLHAYRWYSQKVALNYFFDHNHPYGYLNISALHVLYGIQAFANLSVQNALHCISENFNHKTFRRDACARNSLERCAVRSPDGRYSAHIATIYYISRHPLSQNPLSAPRPWLDTTGLIHITWSSPENSHCVSLYSHS